MNSAAKIVKQHLIQPFFDKTSKHIGIEVEMPICFFNKNLDSKEIGEKFQLLLVQNHGFEFDVDSLSNTIYRVINSYGDAASFDYTYSTLEFSMAKNESITQIATRFYQYLAIAQEYYQVAGCSIAGMGTNFFMPEQIEYVNNIYCQRVHEFIRRFSIQHDPKYLQPYMQSIQTHIDIPGEILLDCLNLMCKLDFARGLLFSNSLPNNDALPAGWEYPRNTMCARDYNWENFGFPNVGIPNDEFISIDHLVEYICNQKIFITRHDTGFSTFFPVTLNTFFAYGENSPKDLKTYWNCQRVVINNYNVLEMRGDCTQPLDQIFLPSAFNTGIAYNTRKARALLDEFVKENNIYQSNSRLRLMAVTGQKITEDDTMRAFLLELVNCAKEGLIARGKGEEVFLNPLYEREDILDCPAKMQLKSLENGATLQEIVLQNSTVI